MNNCLVKISHYLNNAIVLLYAFVLFWKVCTMYLHNVISKGFRNNKKHKKTDFF